MSALEDKVKKESRYKIRKGYNIEQDSSPNPKNLLTFPLSMKVIRLKVNHKKTHIPFAFECEMKFSSATL